MDFFFIQDKDDRLGDLRGGERGGARDGARFRAHAPSCRHVEGSTHRYSRPWIPSLDRFRFAPQSERTVKRRLSSGRLTVQRRLTVKLTERNEVVYE
jgi:hypothetical protein